jgi:hypothetical protein
MDNNPVESQKQKGQKTKNTVKIEVLARNKAMAINKYQNKTKKNKKEEKRKKIIIITKNHIYKTKIETKNATIRYF